MCDYLSGFFLGGIYGKPEDGAATREHGGVEELEFKVSLCYLYMEAPNKNFLRAGSVTQWYSACLAHAKVGLPPHGTVKTTRTTRL